MSHRPTIKELCGLETCTLIGLPTEVVQMKIIGSLLDAKRECANDLFNSYGKIDTGYEKVCRLSTKIKYLDKAISARTQDYEEMMEMSPVLEKYINKEGVNNYIN